MLHKQIHNNQWVHITIGLMGNASFLIGSVCFFFAGWVYTAGIWLFIIGATGMLLDSIGRIIVYYSERKSR